MRIAAGELMSDPKTITFLPTLRPLRTNADYHAVHQAAEADQHRVIAANWKLRCYASRGW